jgi:putative adenylate-forming enzyme
MSSNVQLDTHVDRERAQALCAQMLERERWPRERLLEYQSDRLQEIVRHAVAHSPYYLERLGPLPDDGIELQQLPILTKTTLMAEFDRIVTDPRLRRADLERHVSGERAAEPLFGQYRVVGTGGTTGQRGLAVYDQAAWEVAVAVMLRVMAIQEVTDDDRVLGIGAPTPLHMTNRLFAELRAANTSAPRVSLTTPLPEVVAALNAYQPTAVITYPSFIRRLAEEQQAGRLRIAARKFCSVAETLTQDVRDLAAQVWGAKVLNGYGTTEAGVVAQECPWTTGLHVLEDLLVVEVVDELNRPVPAGATGHKVLITTLFNRTFPLIRYEFSDLVTIAAGPCACGRPHLRLASLQGRREDVLVLPARDGGQVKMNAYLLGETLLHAPAVREYQLNPRPRGLGIRVVLREGSRAGQVVESLRQAITAELDAAGAILDAVTIDAVDAIERSGTGAKQKAVSR